MLDRDIGVRFETDPSREKPTEHWYKILSLSTKTPGINTDGIPAFISPYIRERTVCACGQVYTPLVYLEGEVTVAQHFHENVPNSNARITTPGICDEPYIPMAGGIFIQESHIHSPTGWLADVIPTDLARSCTNAAVIARQVYVVRIHALCTARDHNHEIDEGVLYMRENFTEGGILFPACEPEALADSSRVKMEFFRREERIVFAILIPNINLSLER